MSRRKAASKRATLPDPLFHSDLIAKFISIIMQNGKKSIAEHIVYGALDIVVKKFQTAAKSAKEDGEGGEGSAGLKYKRVTGDIRNSEAAREMAIDIFKKALDNVAPTIEVKSRRVGGATYQVPVEVNAARRTALGMRWLKEFAKKRGEKAMIQRLASEMLDALEGRGGSVKKREDVHRMAKANQAFAHYRW